MAERMWVQPAQGLESTGPGVPPRRAPSPASSCGLILEGSLVGVPWGGN